MPTPSRHDKALLTQRVTPSPIASRHSQERDWLSQVYALACGICERAGVLEYLLQRQRESLVILMYHGVRVDAGAGGLTNYLHKNVERRDFMLQMQLLASHCNVIDIDEAVRCLSGLAPMRPRSVVVTFDDGYQNNYEYAWPICRSLSIPFTLYVVPSYVEGQVPIWMDWVEFAICNTCRPTLEIEIAGRLFRQRLRSRREKNRAHKEIRGALRRLAGPALRDKLAELEEILASGPTASERVALSPCTWKMLQEMANSGLVEIGAHMVNHESLARMQADDAARELVQAKAAIEERLGRPCRHFAYPFGRPDDFGPGTEGLVRSSGYASAATSVEGANRAADNVHALRRIGIYGHYGRAEFLGAITGVHSRVGTLLRPGR